MNLSSTKRKCPWCNNTDLLKLKLKLQEHEAGQHVRGECIACESYVAFVPRAAVAPGVMLKLEAELASRPRQSGLFS